MSNIFAYDNIPVKKIKYKKRRGHIEIKVYDGDYNLIYKNSANFNDKKEMNNLWGELRLKGVKLKYDDSWL